MPNFESFRKSNMSLKSAPHVTIQKRGTISINKSAYLAIDSPKAVELLYDRTRRIIGLRPTEPSDENSYAVRPAASASGPFIISAMAFTRFYDIDTSATLRWPAYVEDGVLCVDLDRAEGIPVTSNRARPH